MERGKNTGGVFTGTIVSYNITYKARVTQRWGPDKSVKTNKGLPVIVYGNPDKPNSPMLAVVAEFGPPEIVQLVQIP